jgi:hypothetical protein
VLSAGCASSPAEDARLAELERRIAGARDRSALSAVIGSEPERCEDARAGFTTCTWRRPWSGGETRRVGYSTVRVPVRYLNAVCELPRDDTPRSADSCRVDVD